jgi:hypothetical protein
MKSPLTSKKIFMFFLFLLISHFLATSIIGQYIGRQIGTQLGAVVADGLIETSESTDVSIVNDINKDMKLKSEKIVSPWKTISFLISLPTGPMLTYLEKPISRKYVFVPMLNKKITREQTMLRVRLIGYLCYFINSFAFCVSLYAVLWIYRFRKSG